MITALEGGERSASHPGRSLPPGKTRYPSHRGLGGPQDQSRQVWKISPSTGIRFHHFPARSLFLYRLSYRANYLRPSSGAYQLQQQPLVLLSERGGSCAVGRGRCGRSDHEQQHYYHLAPTAATAVVVAPNNGHEVARNMLSCI
jgi:hypothetical protein